MSSLWKLLLVALFLFTVFVGGSVVQAQDTDDDDIQVVEDDTTKTKTTEEDEEVVEEEQEEEEEAEGIPFGPHPDVETTAIFPDFPDKRLVLGQPISILLGFTNKGKGSFNITGIGAHLHSPVDLTYFIQNYTARRVVGAPVGPGQQASVEYYFFPDSQLEPLKFWFSAWVLYNNSRDEMFVNTFFNSTIELVEADVGFDIYSYLSYIVFLAGAGLLAYTLISKRATSHRSKRHHSTNSTDSNSTVELTPEEAGVQVYKPLAKSVSVRSRSGSKGRSNSQGKKKEE